MTMATVFIVTGGVGTSAEQVLNTVLAQFPGKGDQVNLIMRTNIRHSEQISEVLQQAAQDEALVVHTLVEAELRSFLESECRKLELTSIDLMGPSISWLSEKLQEPPLERPGFYRQLRKDYFQRVDAIDFTLAHDDGKNPQGWKNSDLLLVGVSRVGKTPLSFYLAVLGWKTANLPLVSGMPVPGQLYQLDPKRVFGITVDAGQLVQHRQKRQKGLGVSNNNSNYMNAVDVYTELQEADEIFRKGRFAVVDMTDQTIEMGADRIIRLLTRYLSQKG